MKRAIGMLGLVTGLAAGLPAMAADAPRPVRVLMIVNEGFMAPEFYEPKAAFERAGFTVTVAGKRQGAIPPDARNVGVPPAQAEVTFEQVDVAQYDAVTFAGGNGAWTDYFPNDRVHQIVTQSLKSGKVTALICASTGLLGVANNYAGSGEPLAKGRRVTGYYRVEGLLRNLGQVKYEAGEAGKPHVVVDGNLITGRDPLSSALFGETVTREIRKRAAATPEKEAR